MGRNERREVQRTGKGFAMKSDVWRTDDGRIGVEIKRVVDVMGDEMVLVAFPTGGFPELQFINADSLKPEQPRYEGARGGRVSG